MGEYWCTVCKSKMIPIGNGYYQCPTCHDDPALLDDEEDDGYGYDRVFGEKPKCCIDCGGNYPDCMDSCDHFDD